MHLGNKSWVPEYMVHGSACICIRTAVGFSMLFQCSLEKTRSCGYSAFHQIPVSCFAAIRLIGSAAERCRQERSKPDSSRSHSRLDPSVPLLVALRSCAHGRNMVYVSRTLCGPSSSPLTRTPRIRMPVDRAYSLQWRAGIKLCWRYSVPVNLAFDICKRLFWQAYGEEHAASQLPVGGSSAVMPVQDPSEQQLRSSQRKLICPALICQELL